MIKNCKCSECNRLRELRLLYETIEIQVPDKETAIGIIDGEFREELWNVWEYDYAGYYNLMRVLTGKVKRFTDVTAKGRILAYIDQATQYLIPCDEGGGK